MASQSVADDVKNALRDTTIVMRIRVKRYITRYMSILSTTIFIAGRIRNRRFLKWQHRHSICCNLCNNLIPTAFTWTNLDFLRNSKYWYAKWFFVIQYIYTYIQYMARIWLRYSLRGLHIRITWFRRKPSDTVLFSVTVLTKFVSATVAKCALVCFVVSVH